MDSKQPDKVLFDRAMDALKHNRFDVARMTLQTLINTYPDSEFIARAKLAVARFLVRRRWRRRAGAGGKRIQGLQTFFPNMPEAAEAQLKIANIHYQQMEKPDRDYTHAMRAEEEYRQLILQYPGHQEWCPKPSSACWKCRKCWRTANSGLDVSTICASPIPRRLRVCDPWWTSYPLYSHADEALYLLGQSYEGEIAIVRSRPGNEMAKARMIEEFTKNAADAYSRILTRYPLMERTEDAKARLEALHQPVPKPTKAAIAQNKAEEESRRETSTVSKVMRNFQKHPDVAQATRVGEPPLVDPQVVSATSVVQELPRP